MTGPSIDQLLAKGSRAFTAARAAGQLPVDHAGATFTRLFFAGADLSRLVLVGSEWEDCHVGAVDFTGADLSNARTCTAAASSAAPSAAPTWRAPPSRTWTWWAVTSPTRGAWTRWSTRTPGKVATHPEFEAALDDAPDDEGRWLVFGDWLQAQGDVRGELVARHGKPGFADFVQSHVEEVFRDCADEVRGGGQTPELTVEWRHGFVHTATLRADNQERPVDLGALAAKVLSLPISRFLKGLAFGVKHGATHYGQPQNEYGSVLEALKHHLRAGPLEHLSLGLQTGYRDEYGEHEPLHHWGDLSALWPTVPRLRTLYLKGGGGELGQVVLPELRHFTLEADYLGDEENMVFGALRRATWPKLERLEVTDVGGALDVPPFLRALEALPRLRHLAIQESDAGANILSALLESKLLPRLEVVDLRGGVLGGQGVELLRTQTSAFRHLRALDLTGAVSEGVEEQVAALGAFIRLDHPLVRDLEEEEESGEPHPDDSGEYEVWLDEAGADEEDAEGEAPLPVDADLDIPGEHGD